MRVLLLARDLLQLLLLSRGGRVGRAKASGRRRSKAREQLSVANFSLRQPLDKRMRVVRLFFWFFNEFTPVKSKDHDHVHRLSFFEADDVSASSKLRFTKREERRRRYIR